MTLQWKDFINLHQLRRPWWYFLIRITVSRKKKCNMDVSYNNVIIISHKCPVAKISTAASKQANPQLTLILVVVCVILSLSLSLSLPLVLFLSLALFRKCFPSSWRESLQPVMWHRKSRFCCHGYPQCNVPAETFRSLGFWVVVFFCLLLTWTVDIASSAILRFERLTGRPEIDVASPVNRLEGSGVNDV